MFKAKAFVEDTKTIVLKAVDSIKTTGKVTRDELLVLDFVYLAAFGLIAILLPGLGATAYGGDSIYAGEWVRFSVLGSLAMAALAVLSQKWDDQAAINDSTLVLLAFHGLNTVVNLLVVSSGSLSKISFLNAVINGGLAYFHFLNFQAQNKAN